MPTSILRVTSVLYIVNLLAFSRTRGFCARGSDKFLPFARWFIAAGRRLLPRRRRDLRCCSSRRRLGPGRAPPGDGRRRASPTRSPTSCASSGWANPRVVAARHPRPSKYHCGRNALRKCRAQTCTKNKKNEPTLPVVNNKKLRQPIRERLGHARDEPRALQLVLDALHRAGPMHLLDQIAPREGHEAVHQTVLGR